MRFAQIPNVDDVWDNVTIKTLSPSTFSWVSRGCGYQVLLQKALNAFNNTSLSLPSNRNAILGTIIHKLYELTLKGELSNIADLKNKWEELIIVEKEKIAANYPTLRHASLNNYDKRNSAIRYALGMLKKTNKATVDNGTKKVYSEKRLDCSDIGLKGLADKLIVDKDCIDVVDFKSGHVKDESGIIKQEYSIQLHLYAEMCKHLSLGIPRTLTLIDIDGECFDIPYSQEYSRQLLSEVQETIQMLNYTISSRSFSSCAKPELGMCVNCGCRHICKFRAIASGSYYQTITGRVMELPSSNMYVLLSGDNTLFVSGLDAYEVHSYRDYLGKMLTFVNVARASQIADDYTYKITENTLVYEQL